MTSIVSRRATHREAATAPVATAETTGGSNERISFAIRWSRSNNYTAPLQRFKAASPYIFSTSRSRGHAVERLRDVDRGSSNVSSSLVSTKKGCRKKLSTIHDHRGNARSLFSPFFSFFYLSIYRCNSILCSAIGDRRCRKFRAKRWKRGSIVKEFCRCLE